MKKYVRIPNYIYAFAIFIFLTATILSKTMWVYSIGDSFEFMLKVIRYVAYIICIFKMFFDTYYFSDFYKIFLLLFLVLVICVCSKSTILYTYIFVFLASYGMGKKMIIKCAVCIQAILLFIIVCCSQTGMNIDYIFDLGSRNRHGLGFTWTTTSAVLFFFIVLEYIYIRQKRMKQVEYVIILILSYVLFRLTDAKLTFALTAMSLVCFWLLSNVKVIELLMRKMRYIWLMMPLLITLFSYHIHRNYKTGSWMWEKLNNFLSGRLKLGNSAIERYGIKLLGQPVEWIGYSYREQTGVYNYVDCSYLQILIQYGLVFLGICLFIYTYILIKSTREGDHYLSGCILIILFFNITEPFLMNLMVNLFPLLAVSYLGQRESKEGIDNNECE